MEHYLSPKQVAEAIGVSESSLKRWCDQGLLTMTKTAGGHRRIAVQEALRFVRENNVSLVEPRLLALPATDDRKGRRIGASAERLAKALLGSNEPACHAIVLELFLAGQPVSRIFDEVFAEAFRIIGEKWECHQADVYQERASCQIALRILHELRTKIAPSQSDRLALGATIEGDFYSLPGTMAELVLRSIGWEARLLGQSIPFPSMMNAIEQQKPALFWLSVSYIPKEAAFISGFNQLFRNATRKKTLVVCGGRALTRSIRTQLRYSAYCDTMQHLDEFARTVQSPVSASPQSSRKIKSLGG